MNRRKKAKHTPKLDGQGQPAAAREEALLPATTAVPGVETKPLYLETGGFRATIVETPQTATEWSDAGGSVQRATRRRPRREGGAR